MPPLEEVIKNRLDSICGKWYRYNWSAEDRAEDRWDDLVSAF